jgi:cytosine deaminase
MRLFSHARIPLCCLPLTGFVAANPKIEPWVECDILVDGSRIVRVGPTGTLAEPGVGQPEVPTTDLGGVLVFPGMLDVHTHLDKTHTWHRAPNPTGEFWDAITVLHADSKNWSEDDLYARAEFAMRTAWSHGTVALRTHLDTGGASDGASFRVANRLKAEWAGRITLQTVSLCSLQAFADGEGANILRLTREAGATAMGGFPQPNPDLPRQMDALMRAAMELGVGLDLHVDESGLPHAECLRATAEAALRNKFPHPIACGHNCSLAVQEPARARDTLELVREAGIALISLPLCNSYLQGRHRVPATPDGGPGLAGQPRTPRWRGLTLIHEALDAGITTACASDNVRDAFFPWGDYDLLEVLNESIRIGHLDTRMTDAAAVVTTGPAKIMGLPDHGRIGPGARSELIITSARTWNEFLARPGQSSRKLISGEKFRAAETPDFAKLRSNA